LDRRLHVTRCRLESLPVHRRRRLAAGSWWIIGDRVVSRRRRCQSRRRPPSMAINQTSRGCHAEHLWPGIWSPVMLVKMESEGTGGDTPFGVGPRVARNQPPGGSEYPGQRLRPGGAQPLLAEGLAATAVFVLPRRACAHALRRAAHAVSRNHRARHPVDLHIFIFRSAKDRYRVRESTDLTYAVHNSFRIFVRVVGSRI
jgi:hypothetical protein